MSVDNVDRVMTRIEFAHVESPIAVFKGNLPGQVNAMFAATVATQDRIARGDPDLIGVFDESMNLRHIRLQLQQATK